MFSSLLSSINTAIGHNCFFYSLRCLSLFFKVHIREAMSVFVSAGKLFHSRG